MRQPVDYGYLVSRLRMRHFEFLHRLQIDPNLGRVARQMHMAQPTASKLLREIEDVLGSPLFVRNRRGLSPTAEGRAITRRAGMMLADLRAAHDELISVQSGSTGRIRLGVFPVAVAGLLTDFLGRLRQLWPGMSVSVEEGDERSLQGLLREGKLDCILGRVVPEALTTDMGHQVLYPEPTVIVSSLDHPVLLAPRQEQASILSRSDWILPHPGGGAYRMVATRLAQDGQPAPRVTIETISVLVTLEIMGSSPMLSVMPMTIAEEAARSGRIAIVPVELPDQSYPVGIIYRKGVEADTPVSNLIALARDAAEVRRRHSSGRGSGRHHDPEPSPAALP